MKIYTQRQVLPVRSGETAAMTDEGERPPTGARLVLLAELERVQGDLAAHQQAAGEAEAALLLLASACRCEGEFICTRCKGLRSLSALREGK